MSRLMNTMPCRGCGAEIAFIKTMKGKTMPVEPEARRFIPEEDGPAAWVIPGGEVKHGRPAAEEEDGALTGYVSHWAGCPARDRFRADRKKGG